MSDAQDEDELAMEVVAKLALLQVNYGEDDVVGQRMLLGGAVRNLMVVSDESLAAFIDGTLAGAERNHVLNVLANSEEYRAIWLQVVDISDN